MGRTPLIRTLGIALFSVMIAGQAQALLCAIPTLEGAFAYGQQASPDHAIVLGVLQLRDAQQDHANDPAAGFYCGDQHR